MSSAVNGWPSDHFMPARRYMVMVRPSSENSQSRITFGMITSAARFQRAAKS